MIIVYEETVRRSFEISEEGSKFSWSNSTNMYITIVMNELPQIDFYYQFFYSGPYVFTKESQTGKRMDEPTDKTNQQIDWPNHKHL